MLFFFIATIKLHKAFLEAWTAWQNSSFLEHLTRYEAMIVETLLLDNTSRSHPAYSTQNECVTSVISCQLLLLVEPFLAESKRQALTAFLSPRRLKDLLSLSNSDVLCLVASRLAQINKFRVLSALTRSLNQLTAVLKG